MLERVGLLALICVCANAVISNAESSTPYEPELAMFCGKATQHRDVNTGEWISGDQDCIKDDDQILSYCKKAYPTLTITNVLKESDPVHVPSWCHLGSQPPCRGHGHNVRPVKCIVSKYVPKALDVKNGCEFQHEVDYNACHTSQHWENEAAASCHAKGKTLSSPEMLTPCPDVVDQWSGVQFLCCEPPKVATPKPNKGKKGLMPIIEPKPSVNSICLQPKLIGACRALLPAWHYNTDSGECEFFHYGGCGGNDNNFQSKEECISTCIPRNPTVNNPEEDNSFCGLAAQAGPCMAYFKRFYYDPVDGACKPFVFGGCDGNKNNFVMNDDCEAKCKGYKKPLPVPIQVEPLPDFSLLNPGPVMLDENMNPVQADGSVAKSDTTPQPSVSSATTTVSSTPFYTDETTIDNEHQVFAQKLDEIKSEHRARVNAILAKFDEDNANSPAQNRQDIERLEQNLQATITALEDEYDGKMIALNDFHLDRMDRIVDEERSKALRKFLDQLNADKPKLRHILNALEKYIAVERHDKTHIMEHYAMAMRDDFDKDSISDLRVRINNIETRVNKTRTVLMSYPDILRRIQDEVEEILATMPDSPDFEYDDDETEEEIVEIPDMDDMDGPDKIDGGGIPDPDICSLAPVVGDCKASLPMYYFNSDTGECAIFSYGGCGGNENNFASLKDCQTACPGKKTTEDVCSLPKVVGVCRAAFTRFYFNSDSGTCEKFTYGGCGGNKNNFEMMEDCRSACPDQPIIFDGNLPTLDEFGVIDENVIDHLEDIDSFPKSSNELLDVDEEEEEREDETNLDKDVDEQFDYYGNRFEVHMGGNPQGLSSGLKSAGSNWAVWAGVGVGFLIILAVVAFIVVKKQQARRPPMKITVDKPPEDPQDEPSAEEKQLLALQQNGYENPTFKFFEKRQMA